MKIIQYVTLLLVGGVQFVIAQSVNGISLHYSGYSINIPTSLENAVDTGLAPVVVGKLDMVPQKNPMSRFGILFRENAPKPEEITILEIIDGTSGKVMKKVSLAEYYGEETAEWKNVKGEDKATETSITSVFVCQVKEDAFKFVREISIEADQNLPGGKKMMIAFSIESKSSKRLKVRFSGIAEGAVSSSSRSLIITNTEPLTTFHPAIEVFVKNIAQIQIDKLKKGKPQTFTVTSKDVSCDANKYSEVLSFSIVGTSILFPGYGEKQAKSFEKYFITRKPVPEIVIVTQTDKQKTHPGDTLMYTIYYHNIGTDVATNISLNGPIPAGARYVDGSAESNGTILTLMRNEAKSPEQGAVSGLNWNDKRILKSGEERLVRYKVAIR